MKTFTELLENINSADKKAEIYTKPDGKKGTRMVPVDKEVIKQEKTLEWLKSALAREAKAAKPREDDLDEAYNMENMCCKNCGDMFGKPTKENKSCQYDAYEPKGKNWIKAEKQHEKVECPKCKGKGCDHCDNKGYHTEAKEDVKELTIADVQKATAMAKKRQEKEREAGKKSVSTVMEQNFNPIDQYPLDAQKKAKAGHTVEEFALDGWSRGGRSARDMQEKYFSQKSKPMENGY